MEGGIGCKRRYSVEEKYVKVCEGLYSGKKTRIVMNGEKSRWFGVERGLRLGCPCLHFCLIFI